MGRSHNSLWICQLCWLCRLYLEVLHFSTLHAATDPSANQISNASSNTSPRIRQPRHHLSVDWWMQCARPVIAHRCIVCPTGGHRMIRDQMWYLTMSVSDIWDFFVYRFTELISVTCYKLQMVDVMNGRTKLNDFANILFTWCTGNVTVT